MSCRHIVALFCFLALPLSDAWSFTKDDLHLLETELSKKGEYEQLKNERIRTINALETDKYNRLLLLFEEYKSYSYDTAYWYVEQLADEAAALKDSEKQVQVQLKRAFLDLSSGLFKESADIFQSIDIESVDSDDTKIEYYTNYARLLYDMADYVQGKRSYDYIVQGNLMSEQALEIIPASDTVLYWLTAALYATKLGDFDHAIERFKWALAGSQITEHEKAIAYSSMGNLYQIGGDNEKAEHYWVLAAVSDLRSSTKEAVAMELIAQMLYEQGDLNNASKYIYAALDDATHYNARHRQVSIGKILPIIEQQQMNIIKQKNQRINILGFVLIGILLLLFALLVFLFNRVYALGRAHQIIETINHKLLEANRIRDEYIGSTFCQQSDLFGKMEKYQRYVRRKAQEKRTDELQVIPSYIDANIQRRIFYKQFDEIFLRIFPNFVENFNALLHKDEPIIPAKNELLNTELRIFALMRLGIENNEQIAMVLNYSINTIYTYKTRVRNRSDLDNEQFHDAVMAIPAV